MTKISEHKLKCNSCGNKFKSHLYASMNVTLNPELIKQVKDGKFNYVKCPKCKKEFWVAMEFLFHDMKKNIMMWVKPENMSGFVEYLRTNGYFDNLDEKSSEKKTKDTEEKHTNKPHSKSMIGWIKSFFVKKKKCLDTTKKANFEDLGIDKADITPHKKESYEKQLDIFGKTKYESKEEIDAQYEKQEKERKKESERVKPYRKKYKSYCEYCHKEINNKIERYYCRYCKKWHCQKHRLPEKHKCPNPKKPKELKSGRMIYSGGKTTYLPN